MCPKPSGIATVIYPRQTSQLQKPLGRSRTAEFHEHDNKHRLLLANKRSTKEQSSTLYRVFPDIFFCGHWVTYWLEREKKAAVHQMFYVCTRTSYLVCLRCGNLLVRSHRRPADSTLGRQNFVHACVKQRDCQADVPCRAALCLLDLLWRERDDVPLQLQRAVRTATDCKLPEASCPPDRQATNTLADTLNSPCEQLSFFFFLFFFIDAKL